MKLFQKVREFLNLKNSINGQFNDINIHLKDRFDEIILEIKNIHKYIDKIQTEIEYYKRLITNKDDYFSEILKKLDKILEKKDPKLLKEQVDRLSATLSLASTYISKTNDQYFTIQSTLSTVQRIEEELEKLTLLKKKNISKSKSE